MNQNKNNERRLKIWCAGKTSIFLDEKDEFLKLHSKNSLYVQDDELLF